MTRRRRDLCDCTRPVITSRSGAGYCATCGKGLPFAKGGGPMNKIVRVRAGAYARTFVRTPRTLCGRLRLRLRGYRRAYWLTGWYQKGSPNQRRLDAGVRSAQGISWPGRRETSRQ